MANKADSVRLSYLHIRLPDGARSTSALYANNRHQCLVIIDVIKEAKDEQGVWRHVALTAQERASVRLAVYSTDVNAALASGWSCDAKKNKFTLGLVPETAKADKPQKTSAANKVDTRVESLKRYLRVDPNTPLEPLVFMARATLAGQVFTSFHPGRKGDSRVVITPTVSLRLGVADLEMQVDYHAFNQRSVDIDLYQWKPKIIGMFFVENRGFDTPVELENEGDYFQTSLVHGVPGVHGFGIKGGTVIKAPGSVLYMSDVHKGLRLDEPNPQLPFRALSMCALKLMGEFPYVASDTQSVWRVVDNYGGLQTFRLATFGVEHLELKDFVETPKERRIVHFEIFLASGHSSTQALYCSGYNQCKVFIEVIAEERQDDGVWQRVSLSDAESDSATVTFFSSNPNEPLAKGWFCDKQKNKYNAGVTNRQQDGGDAAYNRVDSIERYLRVNPGPIETQRFMACVTVGGKVYTTNSAQGSQIFSSSIVIRPTRPYALRRVDLVEYRDRAYRDDDLKVSIYIYYYTALASVRLIENLGLSRPVSLPDEGLHFQTAAVDKFAGFTKIGVVLGKDQAGALLYMNDVHRGLYSNRNPSIRFNERQTLLRIIDFSFVNGSATDARPVNYATFRDTNGCDHRFRLSFHLYGVMRLTG